MELELVEGGASGTKDRRFELGAMRLGLTPSVHHRTEREPRKFVRLLRRVGTFFSGGRPSARFPEFR